MIVALMAMAVVLAILLISEELWKQKLIKGEVARKFVHIFVGIFVASWPFYMEWRWIKFVSLAFFGVVYVTRKLKVFHAINGVKRKSWGDLLFAVGIGLCALLAPTPWIFAVAILHLSLADGLAAIVGERYGRENQYKVLGEVKSIAGTMTYWLVSVAVTGVLISIPSADFSHLSWILVAWLPLFVAWLENISPRGTDNITVPIFITVVLSLLQNVV